MMTLVCPKCRSELIERDSSNIWDKDKQAWVPFSMGNDVHCYGCGHDFHFTKAIQSFDKPEED